MQVVIFPVKAQTAMVDLQVRDMTIAQTVKEEVKVTTLSNRNKVSLFP